MKKQLKFPNFISLLQKKYYQWRACLQCTLVDGGPLIHCLHLQPPNVIVNTYAHNTPVLMRRNYPWLRQEVY